MLQFFNLKSQISNRLTESIQDTSPRIHPSRNKKPVTEKLAPRIYPWGQCFNLKSQISNRLTESIQDTSPRIHPSRNKKPVSEKLAPRIYPWGKCFNLKSQISNLKSIDRDRQPAFSKQSQNPSPMTIPGTWQKSAKKCQVGVKVKERSPAVCINRTLAQKTRLRVKIFVVSPRSSPINRVFESTCVQD